jgi:hypothetical protein
LLKPQRIIPASTVAALLPRLTLLGSLLIFTFLILEFSLRLVFCHSKAFGMEMRKCAVQLKKPVTNPALSFYTSLTVMHS